MVKKYDHSDFISKLYKQSQNIHQHVSKQKVEAFIDEIYSFLFLIEEETCRSMMNLEIRYRSLRLEFTHIVQHFIKEPIPFPKMEDIYDTILPEIHNKLERDAIFFLQSDPAATSLREIQVTYPGFYAIVVYRLAHELWKRKIPLLPRLMTEYAHRKTGIDIHPGAHIGVPFMIDHGTGIVIGETTTIGNEVKIYQGVTLGALSVSPDKTNTKRHPSIGDRVVIYSGATILGGDTTIGNNSIIGGNVWLTQSIDPDTKVFHKSQIILKDSEIKAEPINFII